MSMNIQEINLVTKAQKDYELIDSGHGMKLERYGNFILSRPDPQALWAKKSPEIWVKAHGTFFDTWRLSNEVPKEWSIELEAQKFIIRPATFKHTGVFPEHVPSWQFMKEILNGKTKPSILNLFGYTGGATIACAQAGAAVCHVDASRPAIDGAVHNASLSGVADAPIRWIVDDAHSFVKRELRRGNVYDGIVMDPPIFGRGPKGEVWKVEEHLFSFLKDALFLLSKTPLFLILNGYAAGYTARSYAQLIESALAEAIRDGLHIPTPKIEFGAMDIEESGSAKRLLPAGVYTRLIFL